jgi:nicotinamidase-related amidase
MGSAMPSVAYDHELTGLVLIDTVNEIFSPGGKGHEGLKSELERIGVLENLKRLLAGARERQIRTFFAPMAYTEEDYTTWKHLSGIHRDMFDNRMFQEGSWGAEFHPELSPASGDIVVAPHKNIDVMATTDLSVQLRQHGIEYVAIAGMIGTMCVESTVRTAMEEGFHVTTFTDGTAAAGGPEAYDAMVKRYPLISHATLTVDEFLKASN